MAFDDQNQPKGYVPTSGPSSFAPQQQALQTGLGALSKQQDIAGHTADLWSGIAKANERQSADAMNALRRQAATNLYANRGSLGGGGGLAAMQQADQSAGYALSNMAAQQEANRAALAQQGQQAQLGAQQQIAQAAGERYRILQDQQQRQIRINQALDAARQVMQRHAGTFFTTDADRQKAAGDIQREVLATESDPQVIAAVQNYLQNLRSGQEKTPNTIDV
jgi:hypothetical protein